jgi:hypothetical protein
MSFNFVGSSQLNYWLEPQLLSFEFSSRRILVRAESNYAQPSWRYAGWLQQVFIFPETGKATSTARRVFFKSQQIVEFKAVSLANYQLQYMLPGWLPYVTLFFWEQDSAEELIEVSRGDLLRIEQKIDDISNYSSGS